MCFVCVPVTKLAFISIRCIVWCCKTFFSAPFRRRFILPYKEDSQDSSLKIRLKRQVIATTFCQQSYWRKHGLEQERYLQNKACVPTRNCVKIFPLCQNRRQKRRTPPTSHAFPSDKPKPSAGQGTPVQHFCHAFRAQKTGLSGAFGTDILHSTKASPLDNQSDAYRQKNSIFSRKPCVGRKQAILHHSKQRKSMTTTVLETLTHGMALISHPNKIIVKTFGSIRKSANFVGGTLLTTA